MRHNFNAFLKQIKITKNNPREQIGPTPSMDVLGPHLIIKIMLFLTLKVGEMRVEEKLHFWQKKKKSHRVQSLVI